MAVAVIADIPGGSQQIYVRSGSVKRAAAAMGEGAMAMRLVYECLAATGAVVANPSRTTSSHT